MTGNNFHPLSDSAVGFSALFSGYSALRQQREQLNAADPRAPQASTYSTSLYTRDEEEAVPHQQQRDSLASVEEEGRVHPIREEEWKRARPPPPADYRPELKMQCVLWYS